MAGRPAAENSRSRSFSGSQQRAVPGRARMAIHATSKAARRGPADHRLLAGVIGAVGGQRIGGSACGVYGCATHIRILQWVAYPYID